MYLVVFQHVPVERCRQLIADMAGAAVSEGFIHSCLARAASLAAEVVALIRALITAAAVAGFDETTLRSGPAGEKKYVHGASPSGTPPSGWASGAWTRWPTPGSCPVSRGSWSPTGTRIFHPRWEHIAGNQACLSHLLRDYEDCAESYPGAVWPVQAQRALRGLIHAWHAAREQGLDAIPAGVREPLEHGPAPSWPGWPAFPASPARRTARSRNPAASCWNSAATAAATFRCSPRTSAWADE